MTKTFEPNQAKLLDASTAKELKAIPLFFDQGQITLGMVDPSDHTGINRIFKEMQRGFLIKKISEEEFSKFFKQAFQSNPPPMETKKTPIGEILIKKNLITRENLEEALSIQKRSGLRIGQILVSRGFINRLVLSKALADQYQLPHINLRLDQPDPETVKILADDVCRNIGVIPVRFEGDTLFLAITDPAAIPDIRKKIGNIHTGKMEFLVTSEFDIEWVTRAVFHDNYMNESVWGLFYRNPEECAYKTFTAGQIIFLVISLIVVGLSLYTFFEQTLLILNGIITIIYLVISIFRFWIAIDGASGSDSRGISPQALEKINEIELPVYTILIPVYKEKESLQQLLASLENLDYPKSKLDIKLLLEEDDQETRTEALRLKPPGYIEFITIPHSKPKTKPKACNYGLISARGKYLVIYDAEDKPERDQLKKAFLAFKNGPDDLVCVQAKLNYFNRNQNILTRWFTCEYSNWFDMILPGLDKHKYPIPLGGTSNHFKTEKLRELGGWDPFNVTEDADLGIRMYKHQYTTLVIDSTTFEEANSQLWNWIRQRTRWIKGYMQTWLVDMRHPIKFMKEVGLKGVLGFHLTIGGTPFLFLINPIFWILTTLSFIINSTILEAVFPPIIFLISSFNLIIGNFVFVYLNVISTFRRGYYELGRYALLSPIYWILMSFAAWRAFWQLLFKPSYWEKTTHGLAKMDQDE